MARDKPLPLLFIQDHRRMGGQRLSVLHCDDRSKVVLLNERFYFFHIFHFKVFRDIQFIHTSISFYASCRISQQSLSGADSLWGGYNYSLRYFPLLSFSPLLRKARNNSFH